MNRKDGLGITLSIRHQAAQFTEERFFQVIGFQVHVNTQDGLRKSVRELFCKSGVECFPQIINPGFLGSQSNGHRVAPPLRDVFGTLLQDLHQVDTLYTAPGSLDRAISV